MWWFLIPALMGTFIVAAVFWDDIKETVASWLRRHGLSNSYFMDVWIQLDRVMGYVRGRIYGRSWEGNVQISEEIYEEDQIDDQDVLDELRRRGQSIRNINELVF